MPRFAANLGYLFTDRPLLERIDTAAACGFKAIELQFPYDVPASAVKAAIAKNKLTVLGINTPPGERDGEFGLAAVPGREKDFQGLFARALDYIATIGGSAVHCLAGKVALEQRPAAERVFIDNLKVSADGLAVVERSGEQSLKVFFAAGHRRQPELAVTLPGRGVDAQHRELVPGDRRLHRGSRHVIGELQLDGLEAAGGGGVDTFEQRTVGEQVTQIGGKTGHMRTLSFIPCASTRRRIH